MKELLRFLKNLPRGLSVYVKTYNDVLEEIDKQSKEHSKLEDVKLRGDVWAHLQRLINQHIKLFQITWSLILSILAFLISIAALIISIVL